MHVIRRVLRRDLRAPVRAPRPEASTDALRDVVGNTTLLHVLEISPTATTEGIALRRAGAAVVSIDHDELTMVPPDAFDLAICRTDIDVDLDAVLDRVQAVITDAPIRAEHHAVEIHDGLRLVCRSLDPVIHDVAFRTLRTRVSYPGAPLSRRRRYTEAVHPVTGAPVLVKTIRTSWTPGRGERDELLAEIDAHRALQGTAVRFRHLPELLDHELSDHQGSLVFALAATTGLDDPLLRLDLDRARDALHDVTAGLVHLLDSTGLHHNDVAPRNIGVGSPTILFDLGRASRRRREPFAVELRRVAHGLAERLDPTDRTRWERFVATLPHTDPHALLAHLSRERGDFSR